jgi:predicted nuclease of predicted toxin-antitoxin system
MDLLIDECVPASVAKVFGVRGHRLVWVAQQLGQNTPDALVAETADENNLTLITWNVRDFRRLGLRRKPPDNKQRYRRAGMISFTCSEDQGAARAEQLIESIEFEYEQARKRSDKRLFMEIRLDHFVVHY